MQTQLLDLFEQESTFDNYYSTNNEIVLQALLDNNNQFIHITGNNFSGKTHLLKAWINLANSKLTNAIYLDLSLIEDISIRDLSNNFQYIAIDDIDTLNINQQIELFDLFNAIILNNRNNFLLTSSTVNLENFKGIKDYVKTRILSGLNLYLKALTDDEILEVLRKYIVKEGININEPELIYLVNHYTRNLGKLIDTIRKIVNMAMANKRNISLPFIKKVMNLN